MVVLSLEQSVNVPGWRESPKGGRGLRDGQLGPAEVGEEELVDVVTGDGVRTVLLPFKLTVECICVIGQAPVYSGVGGCQFVVGDLSKVCPHRY